MNDVSVGGLSLRTTDEAGREISVGATLPCQRLPATTDPSFYEPLRGLEIGPSMRFAAGFAHESQAFADQLAIRSIIEDRLHREVVIAAACGLGRRDEAAARAVLNRTAELCTA